jgi:hypothetical protein
LVAALVIAACSSGAETPAAEEEGAGGSASGGAPGKGGRGGQTTPGAGGKPSAGGETGSGGQISSNGGSDSPDAAVSGSGGVPADSGAPDAATGSGGAAGGASGGGTALLVVGAIPLIGSDVQFHDRLEALGLKVENVLDKMATPEMATGKALVVLSYSLDSDNLPGAKWLNVPVPMIVMEHALLGLLGMANEHKWAEPVTQITIAAADSPLAAGFPMGDVTVLKQTGEVFWGIPSDKALKVATVKGSPNHWVIFAYDKGAMMMTMPAPGKRLQFFLGSHLVPTMWLNDAGLKLFDASVAWSIK